MSVRYVVLDQNSGIFVENKFSFKALKKTNNIVPAPNIYLQSKKGRINTTRNRELEDRINSARNREKDGINRARNSKKEGETRQLYVPSADYKETRLLNYLAGFHS